jgi:hypothetical protein
MKVKFNDNFDDLFCCNCKERIHLGEKFVIVKEDCYGEKIEKEYHPECLPEMEDEE